MRHFANFAVLLSTSLSLFSSVVSHASTPDLSSMLNESLDQQESLLNACSVTAPDVAFYRLWLRTRAKVGVEIPGIAKLQFIPEVEILWEKTAAH